MFWLIPVVPLALSGAAAFRARRQLTARNARAAEQKKMEATRAQSEAAAAASPVFGGAAAAPKPPPAAPIFKAAVEPTRQVLQGFEAAIAGVAPGEPVPQPQPSASSALEQARAVVKQVPTPTSPVAVLQVVKATLPKVEEPPPSKALPTSAGANLADARAVLQQAPLPTNPVAVLGVLKSVLLSSTPPAKEYPAGFRAAVMPRASAGVSFEEFAAATKGKAPAEL
jgi:hypothetical protein